MKDKETYDIPAYKFGILKLDGYLNAMLERNGNDYQSILSITNQAILAEEIKIIPFDDIDGLTIEEVQMTLEMKGPLTICCYSSYTAFSQNIEEKNINILYRFALAKEETEANQNQPVDQMIEKLLEDCYHKVPEDIKRMIRCFFERYQDKTHKDTVERIQKINIRK